MQKKNKETKTYDLDSDIMMTGYEAQADPEYCGQADDTKVTIDEDEYDADIISVSISKEQFQKERTRIISDMLDNPNRLGIYDTTTCFEQLDELYDKIVASFRVTNPD